MNQPAVMPDGQQEFKARHLWLQVLLALIFLGMAIRATYLHVIEKDFLRRQGDARMLRKEIIPAHRGMLLDRNGVPLAVSTPVVSLWVNPKEVYEFAHPDDPKKKVRILDIDALAKATGLDPIELHRKIENNPKKEFLYLKRHLAPDVADVVLKQNFPAVYGINEYKRYYPEGETTAHILGFTDLDDNGKEGLELAFNQQLHGIPGQQMVIRDLKGNKVEDVADVRQPKAGSNISLSFDSRIQYIAYRELAAAVEEHAAKAGMAVALDVETGEVLAMVNQPAYNPNNRADTKVEDLRNRVATDMFEPGSVMKLFTLSAGLESGKYTPNSIFNTNPGWMRVANTVVKDHENDGVMDLGGILVKSSNVGAAMVALSLPPEALPEIFTRFGFGHISGSGFPGEARGMMQSREHWHPVEISRMAYGNGIAVTALQLVHAYASMANDGVEVPISFTKVLTPPQGKRLISEKIVAQMFPMMEKVVSADGTAQKASIPGYRVAGKTGTAHKPQHGGYSDKDYMSVFVGFAPVSHPKVVMAVVIDTPTKGSYYGGLVAAPVFSRIMAETMRLMNVPTDKPLDADVVKPTVASKPKPVVVKKDKA